ncbi:unnamed protein product [Bemisia tabaci]|uniref:Uncharacterized protein n=1 Tax=Bemisia tabaci TaxID=7038 RepID=A0A9P0G4N5_BEMTA|nr:unnamed protein product [Bemisia tabaci]
MLSRMARSVGRSWCCSFTTRNMETVEDWDMVRIWWESTEMRLARVFHWGIVIDSFLFHFISINETAGVAQLDPLRNYRDVYSLGPNPRRKKLLAHEEIIALTNRLVGVILPYDRLFCNCRHYTDYVIYGRTFGVTPNFDGSNWRIGKSCPLHRKLERGMNFEDDDFYLLDGHKLKHKINPTPD